MPSALPRELAATITFLETIGARSTDTISPDVLATRDAPKVPVGSPSGPVQHRHLPRLVLAEGSADDSNADLRVIRPLAEGGMGRIDVAEQRSFAREVALKRVREDQRTAHSIEALLREAEITGRLDHPSIVPAHMLGRTQHDDPVLVMKRVEGVPWSTLIHDEAHAAWRGQQGDRLGRHLEILLQVCNAVEFAHRRGVVHRDLKPDNVMVGDLGEVFVLDWGIAVELAGERATLLAGTPAYMAPEMLGGSVDITPRTDVYLLGAILHEVLTGSPPHAAGTLAAVVMSIAACAPATYDPSVPVELAEICHRAMAREPGARFESAIALRDAIADHLRHRGSMDLVTEGRAKLRALRVAVAAADDAEPHHADARRIAAEADFAFRQALRAWPSNPAARTERQACLELMIAFEIAARNAPGARALVPDLPTPRPDLEARIEALAAELAEEARAREALEQLGRERDFAVSAPARVRVLVVLSVAMLATTLGLASAGVQLSTGILFGGLSFAAVVHGGLTYARRRSLFATEANRRLQLSLFLWLATCLSMAGAAWLNDFPIDPTLTAVMLVSTFAALQLAVWTEASTWIYPAVWGPAALLSWLWPGHGFQALAVMSGGSLIGAILRTLHRRKAV